MPLPNFESFLVKILADALTPDDDDGDETSLLSWSVHSPAGSRAIVTVKHRLRDGMMTVRFTNGPIDYMYLNVPRELFRQWKRVKSAGKFYHRRIKNQYNIT